MTDNYSQPTDSSSKRILLANRLDIPVSFGLYAQKDDALAHGDYKNSKKLTDVLRKLKEYADSALGRDCEPSEDELPTVVSVMNDATFVPQSGQANLARFHCKAIISVYVYNNDPIALERATVGVRSALKMVLDEGWI